MTLGPLSGMQAYPAGQWVPEVLDAIDVVLFVSKEFGMVDAEMLEFRDIQNVVAAPAIRIDDAVRHHLALNDRE